jgi:hypothetical protein
MGTTTRVLKHPRTKVRSRRRRPQYDVGGGGGTGSTGGGPRGGVGVEGVEGVGEGGMKPRYSSEGNVVRTRCSTHPDHM